MNVAARRPTYESSTHGTDNGRHALLAVGRFDSIEFFLNNTNLTFLAFVYKFDINGFQNQQIIKLPLAGIELTTPTIYEYLTHSATQTRAEQNVLILFHAPLHFLEYDFIRV